jgi:hypothetical protein
MRRDFIIPVGSAIVALDGHCQEQSLPLTRFLSEGIHSSPTGTASVRSIMLRAAPGHRALP